MPSDKTSPLEQRGFVKADGRRVHYRRAGEGPPMVMMHASPLSSASLRSAMQVFGRHFTCFALDNPGFGLSEPLATGQGDMNAQAGALRQTIAALGLNQPIVYGASTGAAVTHAFGCEFPQDAALCMLDTFSHHDTADMLEGYFPDLAPRRDGGHLLAAWEKICGLYLFSPWQKAEPERRQLRDMPSPDALNDMVLQLLVAGVNYRQLYTAAIAWEDAANVSRLKAPATLNVWESASGLSRVQLLIDQGLPQNYVPVYSDAAGGRYVNQLKYLLDHGYDAAPATPPHSPAQPPDGSCQPTYFDTAHGAVYASVATGGSDRPLVLIHDWGGSSREFDALASQLSKHRPLLIIDLPGHGDTSVPPASPEQRGTQLSEVLCDAMDRLAFDSVDVVGAGAGLLLGQQLRDRSPDRVHKLAYLATAPLISNAADLAAIRRAGLSFRPDASGAHLIRAFAVAKYRDLFWTWWDRSKSTAMARPDPLHMPRIQRRTIDLLKSGDAYLEAHAATCDGLAPKPDLSLVPEWTTGAGPIASHLPASLTERGVAALPSDIDCWGTAICQSLE